jgi:putative drug exporter of the RND superfamily
MFLLGRYNWWVPSWLDRILPHLDPEEAPPGASAAPEPRPVSAPTGS